MFAGAATSAEFTLMILPDTSADIDLEEKCSEVRISQYRFHRFCLQTICVWTIHGFSLRYLSYLNLKFVLTQNKNKSSTKPDLLAHFSSYKCLPATLFGMARKSNISTLEGMLPVELAGCPPCRADHGNLAPPHVPLQGAHITS
jgi:hypothetical protein